MTHSLAIVIMAHPRRRAQAEMLAEYLDALIVWDDGGGEWSTGAHAWKTGAHLGATHTLVLQDDAVPVQDLRRHVLAAIDAMPDSPISLYLGQKKPSRWASNMLMAVQAAEQLGASWISASHLLHGVGIVLPTRWVTPMLQWAEMSSAPYDQRIGAYLRQVQNRATFYTWPSLVDHDDTVPSLVRHADDARLSTDGRIAYRVGSRAVLSPLVVMVDTPLGAEA